MKRKEIVFVIVALSGLIIWLYLGNNRSSVDTYPTTVNGDVFSRLEKSGMDFSKEYTFDFSHRFNDKGKAEEMLKDCERRGYKGKVRESYGDGYWDCEINILMKPDNNEVRRIEKTLDLIAKKYGGYSDGWGVMHQPKNK